MISSLTLEFVYFVNGCPQDGNASLRIETDCIAVHSRILVDNPSGYACGGHDSQPSRTNQHVNLAEGRQCPAPRLVLSWFPRKSKSEIGGRAFAQQCADDSLLHGAFGRRSLHLYLRHAGYDKGTCYYDLGDDLCTRQVCR